MRLEQRQSIPAAIPGAIPSAIDSLICSGDDVDHQRRREAVIRELRSQLSDPVELAKRPGTLYRLRAILSS